MRTSALLALLASAAAVAEAPSVVATPAPATRFELGLPVEVTLVGLTAGVRPEGLYRFGEEGSRSRLRVALGFLAGPEQFLVPLSLGYRALYRQGATVQPLLGAGLEGQLRFVPDAPAVRALGLYLEGGVAVELSPQWSVGALLAVDLMLLGTPGFGFGPRVQVSWRPRLTPSHPP